jgi:C-terminal processing protease CtpA/Prc
MSANNFNKKAQALNDSLCSILTQNLKGIIIDLRINGGGAMHPMILGLMQILGNGRLGAFKTKRIENWVLKNNQFIVDTTIKATIVPKCVIDAHALPCVLLIGTGTGSSGEFLTIAFKGRAKTVFIGTETAGWITVNNGFPLSKITFMNLSIGYGLDRNGKLYMQAIQPDIYLKKNDKFSSLVDDEKVKAAIKWLKSH